MNKQIELEGVMCSCCQTEHNITVDAATLRALLAEPQEERYTCVLCSYAFPRSELIRGNGRGYICLDGIMCSARSEQMKARRKLTKENAQ